MGIESWDAGTRRDSTPGAAQARRASARSAAGQGREYVALMLLVSLRR